MSILKQWSRFCRSCYPNNSIKRVTRQIPHQSLHKSTACCISNQTHQILKHQISHTAKMILMKLYIYNYPKRLPSTQNLILIRHAGGMLTRITSRCISFLVSSSHAEVTMAVRFWRSIHQMMCFWARICLMSQLPTKEQTTPCLKKTSHLWLAITLMHVNGVWYFLAEMLPIK